MTLSFHSIGLSEARVKHLDSMGFTEPTQIQAEAIPPLLAGKDVVGLAQTGTGKTAAFALPMLERLDPQTKTIQALILTPTRELAQQVSTGQSQATTRLSLQLELVGLSRIGSNPLKVLKDNIPGYRLLRDERTTGSSADADRP